MKINLIRNKIVDSNNIPMILPSKSGVEVSDALAIQYDQLRVAFVAARDALIDAYKKAGGEY